MKVYVSKESKSFGGPLPDQYNIRFKSDGNTVIITIGDFQGENIPWSDTKGAKLEMSKHMAVTLSRMLAVAIDEAAEEIDITLKPKEKKV